MPEPTVYDKEKPKADPNAPLTSAELLAMKKRYTGNLPMERVITEALKRRVETPCTTPQK